MSTPATDPTSAPTLERLRAAAAELFAARGYDGASMSEIAQRVGVRKASLYNYYDSKQALLMDLLEESLTVWRRASWDVLAGPGRFEERLRSHLEAAVTFTTHHPEQVAMVRVAATQLAGDFGRRVDQLLTGQRCEYVDRLGAFFRAAMEAGEVKPAEPEDLALTFRAFMDGLLSNLVFYPSGARRLYDRLPQIWRLFWGGLAATHPETS